jgi:hypothetical protein
VPDSGQTKAGASIFGAAVHNTKFDQFLLSKTQSPVKSCKKPFKNVDYANFMDVFSGTFVRYSLDTL